MFGLFRFGAEVGFRCVLIWKIGSFLLAMKAKGKTRSDRLDQLRKCFLEEGMEISQNDLENAYELIRKFCKLAVNQIVK